MKRNIFFVFVIVFGFFHFGFCADPAYAIVDKRLQQKVTYNATNMRLHDVMSDLSRITGVELHCGIDVIDWRVRDIPFTINVNQIRLGKLIRAITIAGDLVAKTEKARDGGVAYRLLTPPVNIDAVRSNVRAEQANTNAYLAWQWDVLQYSRQIPTEQIKNSLNIELEIWDQGVNLLRASSEFVSLIDPKTISKVITGKDVQFTPNTVPNQVRKPLLNLLRALFDCHNGFCRRNVSPRSTYKEMTVTQAELQASTLVLYRSGRDIVFYAAIRRKPEDVGCGSSLADILSFLKLHARPSKFPRVAKRCTMLPTRKASADEHGFECDSMPKYQPNIRITVPDGKRAVSFAEVLHSVAKSTGYSIVCMDTESSLGDIYQISGGDMPFDDALSNLKEHHLWWIDDSERVFVGRQTTNLLFAPASIVDDLIGKANSVGIDLDDMAPLLSYPWIVNIYPDLYGFRYWVITGRDRPLWGLYFCLSPSDKALAKSEQGLSLAKFPPRTLLALLMNWSYPRPFDLVSKKTPDGEPARRVQSFDLDDMRTLVLHIKAKEFMDWSRFSTGNPMIVEDSSILSSQRTFVQSTQSGYLKRKDYSMSITGSQHGKPFTLTIYGPDSLPYFTEKRERQIVLEQTVSVQAE